MKKLSDEMLSKLLSAQQDDGLCGVGFHIVVKDPTCFYSFACNADNLPEFVTSWLCENNVNSWRVDRLLRALERIGAA